MYIIPSSYLSIIKICRDDLTEVNRRKNKQMNVLFKAAVISSKVILSGRGKSIEYIVFKYSSLYYL